MTQNAAFFHDHRTHKAHIGLTINHCLCGDLFNAFVKLLKSRQFPRIRSILRVYQHLPGDFTFDAVHFVIFFGHLAHHISRVHQSKFNSAGCHYIPVRKVCKIGVRRGAFIGHNIQATVACRPAAKRLVFVPVCLGFVRGKFNDLPVKIGDIPVC